MSDRVLVHVARALPAAGESWVEDAGIVVEDRAIASLGPFPAVRRTYPLAREHDARHLIAVPGLIDAHSHGRAIPLAEQGVREGPLELFLAQLTALTPLDARDDGFVAGSDLLATGVTAVQAVFHSIVDDAEGYRRNATAFADGLAASGIEFELVLGFTDRDEFVPPSVTDAPAGAADLLAPERGLSADDFLAVYDELAAQRSVSIAPVAPQWCSGHVLEGIAARVRSDARVHTHLLESRAQHEALPSPMARLRAAGVLGNRLSAAHAVWLSADEIAECAAAGVVLVHCPGSNRKLAGAAAPVREWLDAGVTAALGLDSYARAEPPDVFDELRLAKAGGLDAHEAFGLATLGGAAALGRPELGRLTAGAPASLVLLDPPPARGEPLADVLDGATRHDAMEVWVRGERLIEGGRLLRRRDVESARARLREQLAADAPSRRARLASIAALEPWLEDVWAAAGAVR